MDKVAKWNRLDELALLDETYMTYKTQYNEFAVQFDKLIRWCPRKIRRIFNGYADCGRLMMQRMAGIALENMEFQDE